MKPCSNNDYESLFANPPQFLYISTMIQNEILLKQLNWRYAVKKFDPTLRLSESQWEVLEKALILTPSSYGFQPWQFWVIVNQDLKKKLRVASWNQPQVEDCSHFVVFTTKRSVSEEDVQNYLTYVTQIRSLPPNFSKEYGKVLTQKLVHEPTKESISEWAARQAYIVLGNLMTSAAMLGIDTCPMEGFEPEQYDQILKLKDTPYRSVLACAVGFRSDQDKAQAMPKVRYPASQLLIRVP